MNINEYNIKRNINMNKYKEKYWIQVYLREIATQFRDRLHV